MLERHPYASDLYSRCLEGDGLARLEVPPWRSYVLVRSAASDPSVRTASGLYPFASLEPDCELAAGLDFLREQGVGSVSLVTDALWQPPLETLRAVFDVCRPFKTTYLIDREAGPVRFRKKHRNRINRSNRRCRVRRVPLADHVESAQQMYRGFAEIKELSGSMDFGPAYFPNLAKMKEATTIAAFVEEALVALSIWIRFRDIAYFHLGVSNQKGYEIAASYACHGFAIGHFADCRYVSFGPEVGLRDSKAYPLSGFKSGFANATAPIHLCGASLLSRA
jgi:hypothetical protein